MKAKAVCVMRTDLRNSDGFKVPKGKLVAQGGHAFVGLITKQMSRWDDGVWELDMLKDSPLYAWLTGIFTKIVLGVGSEEELLRIYDEASELGLNTVLITDAGHTEFAEPTITCIGIGPAWSEDIDKITGHLKGFS
jgi:PTH2 family peptidyl-tRNA hydrolase